MIASHLIHFSGSSCFLSLSAIMAKIYFYFSPKIGIPQVFSISINDNCYLPSFRATNLRVILEFSFSLTLPIKSFSKSCQLYL